MNYGLTKTRVRLAGGAAILALSAGAALAQEGVEQVIVSSTRLQSAGFDAPTPTTVVSAADLQSQAKPNVFDAITQLPALQGSTGVGYNNGSTTTGLIGISALGLRGLSPLRTLTLMDGQRVVGGNFNGVVDVSQMPQMLIQRVDVVTGGASASWGSDAVAGVVNFITEKKFEGFKMNASAGLSTYGDAGNIVFQAAAGSSFAGGRGHFEVAGEYNYNDGLLPRYPVGQQHAAQPNIGGRTLARQSGTVSYSADTGTGSAPAGQPRYNYVALTQPTQSAAYGLIQSGPLAYTTFDNNGRPVAFDLAGNCFKNTSNALVGAIGGQCVGTPSDPGNQNDSKQFTQGLYDPLTRGSLYARVSYDLTPTTEVYATLTYGLARTENVPAQGNSSKNGMSMKCDNAYLYQTFNGNAFGANPALGAAGFAAACATAIGGAGANPSTTGFTYGSDWANIPTDQLMFLTRTLRRYAVGGDGDFDFLGKNWTWSSYFTHGETDTSIKIYNMPLSGNAFNPNANGTPATSGTSNSGVTSRFNLAQDAVSNSAGQVVCRNTIAQAYGCVPFNPFGGTLTPGQIAYFDGQNGPGGTTSGPNAIMTQRQEAFSFAVNGSPIEDWAGPVSVAAGYEYREEHFSQRADPYSAGISASTPATANEPCTDPFVDCTGTFGAWNAGNYHNGRGTFHVNEVFVEVGVPLLNDAFWGKADLDIAGRHARYSTAGDANTWKVGVTWDTPLPGVRLRALQSRDIRAPNLSELFFPPSGLNGGVTNDFCVFANQANCTNQQVRQLNQGNINLKPERAQTTQVGLVWQPDFIPGFQASIDYWRIGVKGSIVSLGVQTVEDLCFFNQTQGLASAATFCQQDAILTANGQPQSVSVTGRVTDPNALQQVSSKAFNFASQVTDGFDLEAGYQFDLQDYDIPGSFVLRSLITHVSKFIVDSGIPGTQRNVELAGSLGGQAGGAGGAGGSSQYNTNFNVLNWKMQETQSYQNDVWGFNLTERWDSGGVFTNRNALVCAPGTCPVSTVQTPTINFNKVDAILYVDVGANWNVSDKTQLYTKIDNIANIRPPDIGEQNANNRLYDVIGRMYRIGVRFTN
jgi:iron complex outermembrane receptor protein